MSNSDDNAVYISSISYGKCIENTQESQGVCRLRKWNSIPEQHWIIEPDSDDPKVVAFRSVADGRFLAALDPSKQNGGRIGVSEDKQKWTLEPGLGPQWFHVKSNDGSGYFNDEWGRNNDDNKIQTYQFEKGNPGYNTFYFSSVIVSDERVTAAPIAQKEDQGQKQEDLAARERELEERDAANTKTKQDLDQRTKDFEDREEEMKQREAELARREKETSQQPAAPSVVKDEPSSKPQTTASPHVKEPASKQTSAESQKHVSKADGQDGAVSDPHEYCRLQRKNDSLKAQLKAKELEGEIRALRAQACHHVVRRPPRKIDRKVEGYVYK